jgi:hypothetical protein
LLWLFWRWGLTNYQSSFETWSSWSQPPKYLGLQKWATNTPLVLADKNEVNNSPTCLRGYKQYWNKY